MDRKERFLATIERAPVDRPATWLGLPVKDSIPGLFSYFGVDDMVSFKKLIGDDVWPVEVPYNNPPTNDVGCALNFSKRGNGLGQDKRSLTVPGFFENITDPSRISHFNWPDPEDHLDLVETIRLFRSLPKDYARLGIMWSAHFQDVCAAFGMENALITMMTHPEMFQAVIDRITDFYLRLNELFYELAHKHLDAVLIGNDFGSQSGLMVDPDLIRKYVLPGTKKLVRQAKQYGLKVIHHSCGSIFPIIKDLFDMGVDAIHPIQALAKDMDARMLKENFGHIGSFCGGVDAQELLVHGNPEMIIKKVAELKELFPTGLIISPSHEAILPDIPPENVGAMFG